MMTEEEVKKALYEHYKIEPDPMKLERMLKFFKRGDPCDGCGGTGSLESLCEEERMRGIQDTCYRCAETGQVVVYNEALLNRVKTALF